ncbi:MAG TPA: hypothetical protein VG410_13140 [Solirubrobacteraceae bacterium]|jgi:hypothetical protein|nr:hypothetical protein [Solirubrobacteraceae bacterium]
MTAGRGIARGGAVAAAIALAGCGSSTPASTPTTAARADGWGTLKLASGAALPYPLSWRRIGGDPGTASAGLFNADGTIRAYLNVTPAIGKETLTGWARFRVAHNADEGDRNVRMLSKQTNVPLDGGRGSCVVDQYTTPRTSYRELACVVAPKSAAMRVVLVGAAQPQVWASERHVLQFAIDHFTS